SLSALFRTAAVLLEAASSCARVIPRQIILSIAILNRCHRTIEQYDDFAGKGTGPYQVAPILWKGFESADWANCPRVNADILRCDNDARFTPISSHKDNPSLVNT